MRRIPDEWLILASLAISIVAMRHPSAIMLAVFASGVLTGIPTGRGSFHVEGRVLGAIRAWLRQRVNQLDKDEVRYERCNCSAADVCPFGRIGSEPRCMLPKK